MPPSFKSAVPSGKLFSTANKVSAVSTRESFDKVNCHDRSHQDDEKVDQVGKQGEIKGHIVQFEYFPCYADKQVVHEE
jgi:hypothetical protein